MCRYKRLSRRSGVRLLLLIPFGAISTLGSTGSGSQTLSAAIKPVGTITVPGTAALTTGVTTFQPYTGTVALSYSARTTATGGGSITLTVTNDFSPTGGPSVASGVLQYTCAGATLGTACSGTQTASTSAQTPVVTLPASACTGGGGACSSQSPNSVNLTFTLTDDPAYATGSYAAKVTLTISAT